MAHTGRPLLLLLLLLWELPGTWALKSNMAVSHKPTGHPCTDHKECQSTCCVPSSHSAARVCTPRSMFFQCVEWRKPNSEHCTDHSQCQSRCCIPLTEVSHPRCVPRRGILAQCLLL